MNKPEYILLIGGSGEIGKQIIRKLSNNGYNVIYTYNNRTPLDYSDLPTSIVSFKLNVCLKDEIKQLKIKISESNYLIKGLVYNTGVVDDKLFFNMSDKDFIDLFEVNFMGCFNVCKEFINELSVNKGNIVIMSSISGIIGKVGQINYAVSKAALISFAKNLSVEYARLGIRVNSIAPGLINTPMIDSIPKELLIKMKKEIPLKRIGEAYEIANIVNFLVSSESSYVTGQVIIADGGTTLLI
ncbi:MAG: SDR family oxidoreductase [Dysgonamonadaceae bacterium]|jgi:3-oxoacyl-[acyl-carrier protein] reductase|nr:SDR family oxidoreductase [Dysgonamonadaceae bacterium]